MSEHTPSGFHIETSRRAKYPLNVLYEGGRCYARCADESSAIRIANALNHFDELVEALEFFVTAFNCNPLNESGHDQAQWHANLEHAQDKARAVLEKVKK